MPDPLIVAKALARNYQQGGRPIVAVRLACFQIFPGDRIAIIGPSGCGKSTLLHLMAGIEAATSGTIAWPGLGESQTLRPDKIAMVFQGPSLIPELTALENVSLPQLIGERGLRPATDAHAALRLFDLEALAEKLPEEMSGGQMQRVALARAVAGWPRLILADEPSGQLDQTTRDQVLDRLLAHLVGTETALVITTHDPEVASRMRDTWHMQRGLLRTGAETVGAAA